MKYRGVLELIKRGEKPDGRKYLNYEGKFSHKSAQEIYSEWHRKHGKPQSVLTSTQQMESAKVLTTEQEPVG
jgi:hypothetical protein